MSNSTAPTYMIYLIAGEPSGDLLGARLMEGLQQISPNDFEFYGVGGAKMASQGLTSLFPISDIALMGISEILPHVPKLLGRLNETVRDIEVRQPDAVVTIDSPGFSLRVAKKLKGSGIPVVHYVAPSVWAWKSWRAKRMRGYLTKVLALLDFEPPYFEDHGLPCEFVGHPVLQSGADGGFAQRFRQRFDISPDRRLLGILPGSRKGEVTRHLPVIQKSLELADIMWESTDLVVPLADNVSQIVRSEMSTWNFNVHFVTEMDKYDAFAAFDGALAASGTVALELALAKVPFVTIYKMAPLSNYLARRVVSLKYVNLINILLDKLVVPELLLESCRAELIAPALADIWSRENVREHQISNFEDALKLLGAGREPPGVRAAQAVLDVLN
ncbi:MAG: lipid-A-disaccharide synthase, partial [Rhodospirillales bacterium]|nr:lipid-A-disaccharide synthase [Rhodospirillales bacterium]